MPFCRDCRDSGPEERTALLLFEHLSTATVTAVTALAAVTRPEERTAL
jgi:hypothetical protein